jgi:hypothetical protein
MRHISKKPFQKTAPKPAAKATPKAAAPADVQPEVQPEQPIDPLAPVEVALEPQDATIVQLASERLQNAQLHLQNRQNELNSLLGQVRAKYEEGGKYTMSSIDLGKATIVRALSPT